MIKGREVEATGMAWVTGVRQMGTQAQQGREALAKKGNTPNNRKGALPEPQGTLYTLMGPPQALTSELEPLVASSPIQ